MEELEKNSGEQTVDTTATNTVDVGESSTSENQVETEKPKMRTFTEEEVNKIMQKRVNRSHQSFFDRYKVKDLTEMDSKFALVDTLTHEKEQLANENTELLNKLAFIENDINPERKEDILAYFKGKDIVFNGDNLKQELATHPEWRNIKNVDNTPTTTIKEMSPSRSKNAEVDEQKEVAKMFGLNKVYHF